MLSLFKQRLRFSAGRFATSAMLLALSASLVSGQTPAFDEQFVALAPAFTFQPSAPTPFATSFAVVANASVPVSDMSMDDLKNLFFFRKKFWSGGKRVVLLHPSSGLDARSYLLADIYRLNDAGLKRLILEKLFQGEIDTAPRVVNSYQDALTFLAATRGMIAIVRADAVPPGQTAVKVVRINGKLPGEAGYPLAR